MRAIGMRARALWESITEPRYLKAFYLAVYTVTIGVGIVTLVNPPSSIEGPLGSFLTAFWALLLTTGGVGAASSVLPGWWWAERLSVWLIIFGAGLYAAIIFGIQLAAPPGSSRWTQLGFVIIATTVFFLRLLLTRKWDYEPRRE